MPGINEQSSASLVINAEDKNKLIEAMNILKMVAKKKKLLVIEPIENSFE